MTLYTPLLYALQIAHQQIAFVVAQVHTITLAVAEHIAVGTLAVAHPFAVAEWLKSVLPYIPKVILVDVALIKVATHTCTARYLAIDTH